MTWVVRRGGEGPWGVDVDEEVNVGLDEGLRAPELSRAARLVAHAYREGVHVNGLPEDCRPRTPADGKVIQDLTAGLVGAKVVGWKTGHTNEVMRQRFGDAVPVAGRYFEGMIVDSPASVFDDEIRAPFVEGELVVRFSRDLPPRDDPYGMDEVLDSLDAVIPAIEFADIRSTAVTDTTMLELAAFNAGAFRLILGDPIENWREVPLADLGAQLTLDGEVAATAYYGPQRTDLFWVAHYFANDLSQRGIGLRAGQLLSTGVILPYMPLASARRVTFEVDGQRPIELTIVAR